MTFRIVLQHLFIDLLDQVHTKGPLSHVIESQRPQGGYISIWIFPTDGSRENRIKTGNGSGGAFEQLFQKGDMAFDPDGPVRTYPDAISAPHTSILED